MTGAPTLLGGRYLIERRIGEGGMADVLLARDRMSGDRPVVVKRCKAHLKHQPEFAHLFLREARLASLVKHPNVVELEATGEEDGQPYLVMEYLQGFTVRDIFWRAQTEGGLPQDTAAAILLGAARGVQAAHSARDEQGNRIGLVHRDVSPHNLFVCDSGVVKVLDFGIAKGAHDVTMTRQGHVKGKASYLAPEQLVTGGQVDMRADLFSLGIVAWELFTGQRLFKRASETDTINAIRKLEVPNPVTVRADLDPGYAEIVMRMLARKPIDRPQHAGEIVSGIANTLRRRAPTIGEKELAEYVAHLRTIEPSEDERNSIPPSAEDAPTLDKAAKRAAFEAAWGGPNPPGNTAIPASRNPTPLRQEPEEVTSTVAPPVRASFGSTSENLAAKQTRETSGAYTLSSDDLVEASKNTPLPAGALPVVPDASKVQTDSDAPTTALPAAQIPSMPAPPVPRIAPNAPHSATTPTSTRGAYPPWLETFAAQHPKLEAILHANPEPPVVAMILAGALVTGIVVSYVIVSIVR
jgi:serine/threonine protein kinase